MLKLREDMAGLNVLAKFDAHGRNEYTWCDNIELFINYHMLTRSHPYNSRLDTIALEFPHFY